MSTQFGDGRRTLSTGDLVISVNEIFDRLQTKVDPNTLEQLLRDILAGRRNQVRPGELITAELINQILAELESLQARVTKLEAGSTTPVPTQGQVVITELIPDGSIRIGQELRILGREFLFSRGAARVLLNNRERPIKTGVSSDTELRIDIPPDTPLGSANVRVSNSFTTADRSINILAAQTPLTGNPTVTFLRVAPNTIQTSGSGATQYTFSYELDATAMGRETTFRIDPVISVPEWDRNASIVDEGGRARSAEFQLAPGQKVTFGVMANLVGAVTRPRNFTVRIDLAAEGREWSVADRTFQDGETVLPSNPGIRISTPQVVPTASFNDATNTIRGEARLTAQVDFTVPARYALVFAPVNGTTFQANNWSVDPDVTQRTMDVSSTAITAGGGKVSSPISITFTPLASARTIDIEVGYSTAGTKTVERFTLTT